jgi:fibronectin type 3 domain-containing protein
MPNTFLPAAPVNEGMNYFYVTASWGSHETSPSNTVSYRSASISGFTAIPSASDIALAWNPVNNAQDYTILRGLGYNGPFTPLVTVATNSHTDSTVVGATGYFYKVRANFSDSTVGRFSNPKGAMLTGTHTPTGISLRAQSAGIIKVNWAPVTNAVSNKIYVATSAMGSYTLKATVYVGSEALVGGLSANTEYFIKIQTRVGVTDYDSSIHSELTYQLPDAPTGLIGDNNIDLTWTGIPGVIDYEVLRSLDGINFAPIATNLGSTAFSDNSVSNGQLYYYKLRANFSFGSDVSVSSSGLSPGIVPTAPTRLLVENDTSGTDLRLHWDKVESVNKYNIYVSTTSGSYSTPFTSSTSYQDVLISGLSLGTTYYLIVKSVNGTLESLTSSPEFSIETALTTAAPTVQAANASDVNISWPPVTGATSYNILRSRDGYSFEVLSSGETGNSFVDSTTDPSQTYFYKYQSYKSANVPMAYSQVSSGISIGTSSPAPEGVSISSNVLTAVDLSWIASPATVSYSIFRSLNSGGPYSLLSSVSAPSINFTDSAVTPGGSYFYVIQSVNANGVSSVNSAEVGITLSAAPTNLIANNQEEGIQLSWDTVVGATRYQLLRSGLSGGPYGLVASPAGNSYLDTNTLAGETYFYVVLGEFADGSATLLSSEVSLNRSGSLDLEVPIELTDTRLASASSEAISFERTMTSLDTNDYDGVSSYQFEVIVSNSDNIPHEIYLVNTSDIVVASLSVPASTLIPTRLRAPFSPDVGDQTYRLRLEATTIDGQLVLESARILIKQVNATKTRLYFPLLSVSQISTSADATSPALSTNLSTYQIPSSSLPFTRTTNDLASIALSNAWELEALVSTSFSAEGSLVLQNTATGLGVATSETRFAGDTIMMANIPIDEGSNQFATANENHQYQIQVKCEYNCAMGNVMLYKAGIWVRLENLSKAISYYRNSSEQDLSSVDTTNTSDRTYIDTSLFKNPTAYFEARAYDDAGSMTEVTLLSHPEDSGAAGLILVTNSTLSFDTGNVTTSRSVLSLPLTSGHRFVTRSNASGGDTKLIGSAIIIKSSTP